MTNPWSEAANKQEPSTPPRRRQHAHQNNNDSCFTSTLLWLVKACHVLDGMLGILLTVYGLVLIPSHLHVVCSIVLGVGVLLLLRSIAGITGISSDVFERWGLVLSGRYLSPLFFVLYLILAILCIGNHAVLLEFLDQHATKLHIPQSLVEWLNRHHHALWIVLACISIVEVLRWWLVPRVRLFLVERDAQLLTLLVDHPPPNSSTRRPWWWQQQRHYHHDSSLQDPLLLYDSTNWTSTQHNQSYSMHHGTSPPQNRSFWSRIWHHSTPTQEEESEVDFESVQEEWLSRSEEDPLWWSRDEGNTSNNARDESWAKQHEDENGETPSQRQQEEQKR